MEVGLDVSNESVTRKHRVNRATKKGDESCLGPRCQHDFQDIPHASQQRASKEERTPYRLLFVSDVFPLVSYIATAKIAEFDKAHPCKSRHTNTLRKETQSPASAASHMPELIHRIIIESFTEIPVTGTMEIVSIMFELTKIRKNTRPR